jgi:hypothetical protein
MTVSDPFKDWSAKFADGLDAMSHPLAFVALPPEDATTDPTEVVKQLLAVRTMLRVGDDRQHAKTAAEILAAAVYSQHHKADMEERVVEVVNGIDKRIAATLAKMTPAQYLTHGLIKTSDFKDIRRLVFPDLSERSPLTNQPEALTLIGGVIDSLPADHPLRAHVAEALPDGAYAVDRTDDKPGTGVLLLGRPAPSFGSGPPHPVYHLTHVMRWTRQLRSRQTEKLAELERQEREERRRANEEFWASDLGKRLRVEKELERLREMGQLPPELPTAPPAVRLGR